MCLVSKFKTIALIALFSMAAFAGVSQASTSVSLDLGADKSFTYKNVDADGNKLTSDAIVNAIVQAIYNSTSYKSLFKTPGMSDEIAAVKGVDVTKLLNEIEVSYINGVSYASSGKIVATRSSAKFEYSIEEAAGSITVKFVPPKQIETQKAGAMFLLYPQFASDEELVSDIQKVYKKLDPIIVFTKMVRGEVNAKYAATPITANFKRKCSLISSVKDGSFTCIVDNKEVALEVLPYKEGSKVTYKFSVKYSLNGKGESDYSPESTKKIIAGIENIVND